MGKKAASNPKRQAKFKDMATTNQALKNKENRWNRWFKRMEKLAAEKGKDFAPKYTTWASWHAASTKAGKAGFEKHRQLEHDRRFKERKGFKPLDEE